MNLEMYSWPVTALGDGLAHLARRAGIGTAAVDAIVLPSGVDPSDPIELGRWVSWAAERLGLEVEAVDVTAASVDALLLGAGPAVVQCDDPAGVRFFLLLPARFGRVRLLCPDLSVRSCPVEPLRDALCAERLRPMLPEINHLLNVAEIAPRCADHVRSLIARDRLGNDRVGQGWVLRVPPTTGLWRQLTQNRVPRKLVTIALVYAGMYALEILGWAVIGRAALDGRLDLGWLAGWTLLMLSLVPLRMIGGWIDAMLSLDVARLLKTRLLVGALKMDVDAVRREGVGQLLGRVLESQAFESMVLTSGFGSIVALVELACGAWVLSLGAAGFLHVALLLAWLAAGVGFGYRYFRRLDTWTSTRLAMTQTLIERMVGHRTALAQESPERRDREQDAEMNDYLRVSAALDDGSKPVMAGIPIGWQLLGLAALVPAFVAGTATPAALAISLGGILLAGRAFAGIASGLSSAAGAVVAWKQIAPLYRAAGRAVPLRPFITAAQMAGGATAGTPLVDGESITYRYSADGVPVLRDASLTIDHGEKVLIEGPSGGGKSTLASLIVGLREPQSGLLLLNGLDRFTLGDSWHQFATEAPQFHENHVLGGTIGFNLLMGRNWPATDEELDEARGLCEELGLGDLLARMPSGMRQAIGETGWQLSHGERSRLFLARALLQNAALTILDESFAALDPESLERCLGAVLRRSQALAVIAHP